MARNLMISCINQRSPAADTSADIFAFLEISKVNLPGAEAQAGRALAINSAMGVKDMEQTGDIATSANALCVTAVGKSKYLIRCSGELQEAFRTKKRIIVPQRKSRLSWRSRQLPLNKKSFTRLTKKRHGSASSERTLSFLHSETMGDMPLSWPKLSTQHLATALTEHSVRVTIDFQVSCRL